MIHGSVFSRRANRYWSTIGRLVKCQRESAGKKHGTGGARIGNPYLRRAFGEAAALFLRGNPDAQRWLEKKTRKHNKARAMSILAHKLGRVMYFMLKRQTITVVALRCVITPGV